MLEFLKIAIEDLKAMNNYREVINIQDAQRPRVHVNGREYIMLASSSYLGLNTHLALIHAAQLAAHEYGVGSGGSRLISGTMSLHTQLEAELASFLRTDDAILFNSGYDANLGAISTIMTEKDIIFSDELNHASIIDGCQLSKASLAVYKHNNMEDLEQQLKRSKNECKDNSNKFIITDTIFSMDGDLAKLNEIVELAEQYDAYLMIDEAHAVGVFGEHGRGVSEHLGVENNIDIRMGALSKGLGCVGGYIAGSGELVDYLRNKARSYVYTTSLPPPVLASALAALEIVSTEPGRMLRKQLWDNVEVFKKGLNSFGHDTMSSTSQIVPILLGSASRTMEVSKYLFDSGVFATGIRPPTVAPDRCRLRTTVLANHCKGDIADVLEVFRRMNEELTINC